VAGGTGAAAPNRPGAGRPAGGVRRHRIGPRVQQFGWFDVLLGFQGRRIVVAAAATEEKADLLDDFVSRSSTVSLLACTGCGWREAGPMT
jgi:hypothetical protein